MKTIRRGLNRSICSLALLLSLNAFAADPTALELIKLGNDYVSKDSKDKVVQIRSEKSIGSLTPTVWYVVYYDQDAALKATEVKFGAGKKMKVTRPMRLLEPVTGNDRILNRDKITIDSDKAISLAAAEPVLKPLTLRAAQMWLEHGTAGPVWRVRLWAAKLKKPMDDADIGEVTLSAEDGKVIKSDLHINRVD